MKKIICTLFLALAFSVSSFAQVDKEYKSSLKKLFEVSGTEEAYKAAIKQMIVMFKAQKTEVPATIWDEFEQEFLKTSLDELVEMLAPVYKKYMTKEDLGQIIQFYDSPVGKKYAQSTPLITQESMEVGQAWGAKIGESFAEKLKKKGY